MTLLTILIVWAILHYSIYRPRINWFDEYYARVMPKTERWIALFIPLVIFAFLLHTLKHSPALYFIINILILWYGWSYSEAASGVFARPLYNFSLIFWYVILGPLGVLLYDFMRRANFAERSILEWPAARILSFGYALAGHFPPAFTYWRSNVFKSIENHLFLENCGEIALQHELLELNIKSLIKRAQVMLLLVLVIFYVGMLL